MTRLYGLKNCDTVKKARSWLDAQGIAYEFHDFRVDGVNQQQVSQWLKALGQQTLINTRGTTWRQLTVAEQAQAMSDRAVSLLLSQPTLIKRPLLEHNGKVDVGFSPEQYQNIFS